MPENLRLLPLLYCLGCASGIASLAHSDNDAPPSDQTRAGGSPNESPAPAPKVSVFAVLPINAANATLTEVSRTALEEDIRSVSGNVLTPLGFTVLTGETTLRVLTDNGVDPAKACEGNCVLSVARDIKADNFIAGIATSEEGQTLVFLRLFESRTGRQLSSVRLQARTGPALRCEFERHAGELFEMAGLRINRTRLPTPSAADCAAETPQGDATPKPPLGRVIEIKAADFPPPTPLKKSLGTTWHQAEAGGNCHNTFYLERRNGSEATYKVMGSCGNNPPIFSFMIDITAHGDSIRGIRHGVGGVDDCNYTGRLTPEHDAVSGTYSCSKTGFAGPWTATIDP